MSEYMRFHNKYEKLTCEICFPVRCFHTALRNVQGQRGVFTLFNRTIIIYSSSTTLCTLSTPPVGLERISARDTPTLEVQEVAFPPQQRNELQMIYILIFLE